MNNLEMGGNLVSQSQLLVGEGAGPTEYYYFLVAMALGAILLWNTIRRGTLSIPALCYIGGFSIFWQEFYADWGAYLLWSPQFNMMPWESTLWTTPDKPWFTLWAYPVFMCVAVTTMVYLVSFARRKLPSAPPFMLTMLVAVPILYLFNVGTEYKSVVSSGQWTYVHVIGPALSTAKGTMPLLWPGVPFAIWGGVITYLIGKRDANDFPGFERIVHAQEFKSSWRREGARALTWVVVFNLTYWLILCTPLILVRILFGTPNALVP